MPEQSLNESDALKLEIARDTLALEREKFELEKKKVIWTAISVVVPVIAVAATIMWGIVSAREQAAASFKLEAEQAAASFTLEAAKAVMASKNYGDAVSLVTMLRENFPGRFGKEFFPTLNITDFPDARNVGAKWNFMQYIAARGLTPTQAQQLYHLLYPLDDDWAYRGDVRQLLDQASTK